jgi:hypothetical protein
MTLPDVKNVVWRLPFTFNYISPGFLPKKGLTKPLKSVVGSRIPSTSPFFPGFLQPEMSGNQERTAGPVRRQAEG